ncbi:efflux RND transporter periplasmic adaptor subunit [Thalassotalea sp. 1_MG-2023]|uniref:efflux RND transporter periplasmic adaptor subunit n=1 Tax=Thalassotalea sp. 1_MG-2023 TaxID=3062680 RepID=UPI0026E3A2B7|nr:HlyD family efflux transporter periplasmic adaptor subunit [Thalassotalea sp. 1_MG-2023]MDO6428527.1 efflux RND transporter periplasmic adaptor subunit [Thalassotalea sp. 1_MG-2023]
MDVVKQKPFHNKSIKRMVFSVIVLLGLVSIYLIKQNVNQVSLNKKDLVIAQVTQGDLKVTVDGYGKLISHKQELITSLTRATVKQIVLKPGAVVEKGSLIVKLENPELGYQLSSAQQQLVSLQANSRQLALNQQREVIAEQSKIAEYSAKLESASLKREAEEKLFEQGIVSGLKFRESQLNEKQLKTKIKLANQSLEHLQNVHQEALLIQQERINQQLNTVKNAQDRLDALNVVAKFDGILQRLPISLGQSINPGQEIALIGSTSDLIAEIHVPQSQANAIRIGQQVEIDTRQSILLGKVSRIDPIVQNNSVLIDVAFTQSLDNNMRPEQNVDAEIITDTLSNVAYIERPANIQAKSQQAMYRLEKGSNRATRVEITFGQKTSRYVAIMKGAAPGDSFILTDLTNYQASEIALN